IHQNGRLAMRMQPIGVKQRVPLGRDDLDIVHPNAAQLSRHKFRRLQHVAFVFIERADAGDAEKVLQLIDKTRLIIAGKIHCRGSHVRCLSGARGAHTQKMIAENVSVYTLNLWREAPVARVTSSQEPETQLTATAISQTIGSTVHNSTGAPYV